MEQDQLWQILDQQGRRSAWLAHQIGVSRSHLSHLRAGRRRWQPHQKQAAARALGVAIEEVFVGIEEIEEIEPAETP